MRKQLFLCFILGIFVSGIARSSDMTTIQAALTEVGVKCNVDDDGDVVGHFTMDNDKSYLVWVDRNTFSESRETFRQVWGQLGKRPKAEDISEDQLEWILVNNGTNKFGGYDFLYGSDDSTILVRIPVPTRADGKTLKSAMLTCARLLEEADGKIPEVGSSSEAETPKLKLEFSKLKFSSEKTRPKASASKVPEDDISDILAKAENHDGIVIGGWYLGMSLDDAKRVAEHTLGLGYSTTDWREDNRTSVYQPYYANGIKLTVLMRNDRVVRICFGPRVIRKLVNLKNPVSKNSLGRRFFSHFDLEWGPSSNGWNYNFGWEGGAMETPEGEVIGFDPREDGEIRWYFVKTPPELEP